MQIYRDNTGSQNLVKNARINNRSKHIDVAYHNTRDLVKRGRLIVSYVPTADMIADGLTKPLTGAKHIAFLEGLNLQGLPAQEHSLWGSVKKQASSMVATMSRRRVLGV